MRKISTEISKASQSRLTFIKWPGESTCVPAWADRSLKPEPLKKSPSSMEFCRYLKFPRPVSDSIETVALESPTLMSIMP